MSPHMTEILKKSLENSSVCDTLNRVCHNKVRKEMQRKFYRVMAVPILLYLGSHKKQLQSITAMEMTYLQDW